MISLVETKLEQQMFLEAYSNGRKGPFGITPGQPEVDSGILTEPPKKDPVLPYGYGAWYAFDSQHQYTAELIGAGQINTPHALLVALRIPNNQLFVITDFFRAGIDIEDIEFAVGGQKKAISDVWEGARMLIASRRIICLRHPFIQSASLRKLSIKGIQDTDVELEFPKESQSHSKIKEVVDGLRR